MSRPLQAFLFLALVIFLLVVAACGSDRAQSGRSPAGDVVVVARDPVTGTLTRDATIDVGAPVDLVGVSSSGRVLAIASGDVFEVVGSETARRSLYASPGDPTSLSVVHGVTPRSLGGAWVASQAGLFMLDTFYVTRSPIQTGAMDVLAVHDADEGPLEGVWIGADVGLFLSRDDRFEHLRISGVEGAISGIAVETAGSAAIALSGGSVTLLEATDGGIVSDRPPLDSGVVHAVAASNDALYAASERGLLRWRASDSPAWTRFSLSSGSEPPLELFAIAVHPASGDVWARAERSIVHLAGDSLTAFEARPLAPGEPAAIAIDSSGTLWTADDTRLERASASAASAAVSFARDVLPWVSANCSQCHRNQTQNFEDYRVFSEKADAALARVRAGDMPRCTGGVPCPPEQKLGVEAYAILEQWIRAGKPE